MLQIQHTASGIFVSNGVFSLSLHPTQPPPPAEQPTERKTLERIWVKGQQTR